MAIRPIRPAAGTHGPIGPQEAPTPASASEAADRIEAGARPNRRERAMWHPLRSIAPILPIVVLALSSSEGHAQVAAQASCEREITRAAARYDIPLAVFYAVGLNETGWKGRLQPYSMNIDGRAVSNASLAEALARFRSAKAAGARMIDIGCMQINQHYHGGRFASLDAMFDPSRNVDYAARFLRELKQRERTWTMAVARYNAGPDNNPAQKRYVCGVLTRMVASGFGAWTESARNFCFGDRVAKATQ